jgi:short-subunit dehydrogenase
MAKLDFKDKWVLITGASSGLGRAIALHLARKEKAHLVITARSTPRLEQLKKEIQSWGNTRIHIITADLSQAAEVDNLFNRAIEIARLDAVINNAGFTFYGKARIADLETFEKIMAVNFKAVMNLTLRFLAYFEQRGTGAILNITSEAGLLPTPFQTVYSASKHAAQVFTEGLRMENRKSPVVISSFAPGGIATELLAKSGLDKKHGLHSPFNMNVEKAARLAVRTLKKKKFVSVPGFVNNLILLLTRMFPRKWVAAVSEMVYRP